MLHYLTHGCANKEIAARLASASPPQRVCPPRCYPAWASATVFRLSIWGTLNPDFVKAMPVPPPSILRLASAAQHTCSFVHGLVNPA